MDLAANDFLQRSVESPDNLVEAYHEGIQFIVNNHQSSSWRMCNQVQVIHENNASSGIFRRFISNHTTDVEGERAIDVAFPKVCLCSAVNRYQQINANTLSLANENLRFFPTDNSIYTWQVFLSVNLPEALSFYYSYRQVIVRKGYQTTANHVLLETVFLIRTNITGERRCRHTLLDYRS